MKSTVPQSDYRVVYHTPTGRTRQLLPRSDEEDTVKAMSARLDELVEFKHATGGHLETYMPGIGWIVEDEE